MQQETESSRFAAFDHGRGDFLHFRLRPGYWLGFGFRLWFSFDLMVNQLYRHRIVIDQRYDIRAAGGGTVEQSLAGANQPLVFTLCPDAVSEGTIGIECPRPDFAVSGIPDNELSSIIHQTIFMLNLERADEECPAGKPLDVEFNSDCSSIVDPVANQPGKRFQGVRWRIRIRYVGLVDGMQKPAILF